MSKYLFHHCVRKYWKNMPGEWEAADMPNHALRGRWKKRTHNKKMAKNARREFGIMEPRQLICRQSNKKPDILHWAINLNTVSTTNLEIVCLVKQIQTVTKTVYVCWMIVHTVWHRVFQRMLGLRVADQPSTTTYFVRSLSMIWLFWLLNSFSASMRDPRQLKQIRSATKYLDI